MAESFAPTKSVLLRLKRSLKIAIEGYDLLDRKRNVLIRELMSILSRVKELEKMYNESFHKAIETLKTAQWIMGRNTLQSISLTSAKQDEVKVLLKSVMGVSVPQVSIVKSSEKHSSYSPMTSNALLDEAQILFRKARDAGMEMAALETTVIRLATEIKRTQKRANALNNIMIPRYQGSVKFIVESLEEKEREEFFKVKLVKKKKR